MDKLLYKISSLLLLIPVLVAQIPTDYPPIRTKEVPDHMQDQIKWLVIIGGIILILLLVGYFLRFDKKLAKWLKK